MGRVVGPGSVVGPFWGGVLLMATLLVVGVLVEPPLVCLLFHLIGPPLVWVLHALFAWWQYWLG